MKLVVIAYYICVFKLDTSITMFTLVRRRTPLCNRATSRSAARYIAIALHLAAPRDATQRRSTSSNIEHVLCYLAAICFCIHPC